MVQSNTKMNEARGSHGRLAVAVLAFAILATAPIGEGTAHATQYSWDERDQCLRSWNGTVWETYQCNAFFKSTYCDQLGCGRCLFVRTRYTDGTYSDEMGGCYNPTSMNMGGLACYWYETVNGFDYHMYSRGDGSGRWYFVPYETQTVDVSVDTLPADGDTSTVPVEIPEIPVGEDATSVGVSTSVDFNADVASLLMSYYNSLASAPWLLPDPYYY